MIDYYEEYKKYSAERLQLAFYAACISGELEKVKILIENSEFKSKIDIHRNNEEAFQWACVRNREDVVKYLLELPNKEDRPDIHTEEDAPFKVACYNENYSIVKYFIFEYGIEKTEEIQAYMKKSPEEVDGVEEWFNVRDLNKKLNEELPNNPVNKKGIKL